jgi:hypothetical protein
MPELLFFSRSPILLAGSRRAIGVNGRNFKLGFVEEDAPRGTFAKVPLGTPQNFWKKF